MDDDIRVAVDLLRDMAVNGIAPSQNEFMAAMRDRGGRSIRYFKRLGLRYSDLVSMAGLALRRNVPARGSNGPELAVGSSSQSHRASRLQVNGRTWIHTGDGWASPTLACCRMYRLPTGEMVYVLR